MLAGVRNHQPKFADASGASGSVPVILVNFIAFVLLLVVFLRGGFVRLPGAHKEISAVEREQLRSEDAAS